MADRHGNKELPIFRLFAAVCGITIDLDSIEKREPPEPDILCVVTGEGPVAFEMVELIDQGRIAKPTGDQGELMDHFRNGLRNLLAERRVELGRRFGDAWVQPKLRGDISLRRRKRIAGAILERMFELDIGFEGTFRMNEGNMEVASVDVRRRNGLVGGPHIRVLASASYDPVPLNRLRVKFEDKSYRSHAPMELLAYYYGQQAPLEGQLRELFDFIEAHSDGSPFSRVWVFDVNARRLYYP